MRCENCGSEMTREWRFCPGCGFRIAGRKDLFNAVFGSAFSRIHRQMREMDHALEKNMDVVDLTSLMRPSAGFSIKITQTNRERPEVSIRTFGDVDRQKIEQQVQRQLGVRPPVPVAYRSPPSESRTVPRLMEEPKAVVNQKGALVELELPGVVSQKDIHIADREHSVEIKAVAGDKAFFKIIAKPDNAQFVAGRFEKGRLVLEFSR